MCGRFTQVRPWSELVELYRITESTQAPNLKPRYNVAPTQDVPIVRRPRDAEGRELVIVRWGLVPFWAKDVKISYRMINARAETVHEKPAFRQAFQKRRCLVAADGFYEWQKKPGGKKQPYFITVADDQPFPFAGLWEVWKSPEDERIESCTIVVTEASERLRSIHDRMPVILEPEKFDPWLDMSLSAKEARALLKPYGGEMTVYPVSSRVNNVRNDDPGLIEATGDA